MCEIIGSALRWPSSSQSLLNPSRPVFSLCLQNYDSCLPILRSWRPMFGPSLTTHTSSLPLFGSRRTFLFGSSPLVCNSSLSLFGFFSTAVRFDRHLLLAFACLHLLSCQFIFNSIAYCSVPANHILAPVGKFLITVCRCTHPVHHLFGSCR